MGSLHFDVASFFKTWNMTIAGFRHLEMFKNTHQIFEFRNIGIFFKLLWNLKKKMNESLKKDKMSGV